MQIGKHVPLLNEDWELVERQEPYSQWVTRPFSARPAKRPLKVQPKPRSIAKMGDTLVDRMHREIEIMTRRLELELRTLGLQEDM